MDHRRPAGAALYQGGNITMYLNTVDFGAYNTYGIKSAARTYFNTTPDKLTPDQAALLIAMLNGPGYYSPISHPERALNRRNNVVLALMGDKVILDQGQLEKYRKSQWDLNFNPDRPIMTGLRHISGQYLKKRFKKYSIRNHHQS